MRRVLAKAGIVALAASLTLVIFHQLAFSDLILGRGDTFSYFYPYWGVRDAALRSGALPLWSPDLFTGVPLLANSQLGTFYPPNWVTISLSPPYAVRISILIHAAWAFAGAYALARRALALDGWGALTAGALFAFGGYLGGRVEQINQLQGLSWLPWLFLLLEHTRERLRAHTILLLGGALALQFFTGHTQTVFISVVGMGIYALVRFSRRMLVALAAAGVLALVLALPQLLPTLELTAISNRSAGLMPNQATAFSFSPFVMGRGLLPNYDTPIFGEYIAYLGIGGIALALVGTSTLFRGGRRAWMRHPALAWLVVALVGLALAFGLYNPIYWALASLPGFNWFRVPARWLALFALGTALLAGAGVSAWRAGRGSIVGGGLVIIVAGLAAAALVLTARNPDSTPITPPALPTLIGWSVGTALALAALAFVHDRRIVAGLVLAELLVASGSQAFNLLVPRETYTSPRFTAAQLGALNEDAQPPGRMLSISQTLFDPGDLAALQARYTALGTTDTALPTALTNIKLQEVLAPNLPLAWGLPTVDGFDGGVLPTQYYTAFTSLLLPEGSLRTVDGRLREALAVEACSGACVPDWRWLNLMGVQYLVIDKVFDLWRAGIAYDTGLETLPAPNHPAVFANVQRFEANAVDLLYACAVADCPLPTPDLAVASAGAPEALERYQWLRYTLAAPLAPAQVSIMGDGTARLRALTLVDTRTGDFQQLAPLPWTRILSSDIKIYENAAVLPRAFVVYNAISTPDTDLGTESALEIMRAADFDPLHTVILHGDPMLPAHAQRDGTGAVDIIRYEDTRIEIQVESDRPGWLVLLDAFYPGWIACSEAERCVSALRANVMFRAFPIQAGSERYTIQFAPSHMHQLTSAFSGAVWLIGALVLLRALTYITPAGHTLRAD